MAIGGGFVAGSIISKLVLDTTKWDASVKGVTSKTGRLGTQLGKFGGILAKKVTLPLALAGAAAVKVAADFEQKLVNAFSVTGSSSEAVKQQMSDLAREMGATTVFAATDAADAMYYMASAGWKADDMAAALKDTLDLAAATQTDLAMATEAVISTINQFQLVSADAGRVSNVFASAISNSQATMDRLKTSMRYVGPVMNSLGVSVEETTSILMGLYNAGIDASTAGTALRMGLTKLMVPTKQSAIALDRLKLSFEDVNPETHKLADIIQLLGDRGATTKDILMLFGQRAGPAFAALIAKGGNALKEYEKNITGTNRAAEMAEMQIDTFKGSMKLLTSALTEAGISIGDVIAPAIRSIADGITGLITKFNELGPQTKAFILTIAGIAAAMGPLAIVLGKVLILVSKLKTAFIAAKAAFVISAAGIGILVAALAVLVIGILKVKKAQDEMNKSIKQAADQEAILETKLAKAAEMAGMTALEFLKLRDAYHGNAAAMTMAIKKGKEGVEIQEALVEVSKEQKESIDEQKGAIDESIPSIAELTAEFAKLGPTEDEAKKAAEEWTAFMKSIGITTIQEKADRVKDLEGKLEKLHKLYKSGALDMKEYVDGVNKVNKEIKELSTTLTTTALPAARFTVGEIVAIHDNATGEMKQHTQDFTEHLKKKTVEIIDIGAAFSETFAGSFNESLRGMLEGTMTWKDAIGNILGSLKSTAIGIFADIATGYVKNMVSSIVKGTAKMATNISTNMATIGKGIAGIGKGLGQLIISLAKGIAGAAKIIAQAAPAILIAAGVALAIYAGFKIIGSLFKKKAGPGSELDFLRKIAENTTNIKNLTNELKPILWEVVARGDQVRDAITGILTRKFDAVVGRIDSVKSNTLRTAKATEGMAKQLKDLKGAKVGATFTGTELAVMHGTPAAPEIATPISMIGNVVKNNSDMIIAAMKRELEAMKKDPSTDPAKIAAFEKYMAQRIANLKMTEQQKLITQREQSKVEMRTDMNIHIEVKDQIDPHAAQRIMRDQMLPQFLRAVEVNDRQSRTKLEEILKLRI